jgi:WD40 repeat protein
MLLGSRQSNTSPTLLIASYATFRGLVQWDMTRGTLLRVIGPRIVSPAVAWMAFQPRAGLTAPQLFAPDANMLGLWLLQPPSSAAATGAGAGAGAGEPLARSVLRLPPRARDPALAPARPVAPKSQHFGAVVRVAFHPRGSCAASCEANGVVKLWQPKDADEFDSAPAHASSPPLLWTDEATVAWTHVVSSRDSGNAGGDGGGISGDGSEGFLDDSLSAPVHLTCLSFAPSPRALLAVGGLNHGVTLLDPASTSMPLALWRTPGRGDCVALGWSEGARFLVTVDRRHTVSVWRIPTRFIDAFTASADAITAGTTGDSFDVDRSVPLLHAQYFNQSLSSGLAPLSPSSYVFVSFVNGDRHLLFHHAQENCVKIWRTAWAEQESAGGAAAAAASSPSLVPLSTPVLFHCDRLTSSSQNSIIHFLTTR